MIVIESSINAVQDVVQYLPLTPGFVRIAE